MLAELKNFTRDELQFFISLYDSKKGLRRKYWQDSSLILKIKSLLQNADGVNGFELLKALFDNYPKYGSLSEEILVKILEQFKPDYAERLKTALWRLKSQDLFNLQMVLHVVNHSNPEGFVSALYWLSFRQILTDENINYLQKHAYPNNLAQAFHRLNELNALDEDNIELLFQFQDPEDVAFIIGLLNPAGIDVVKRFYLQLTANQNGEKIAVALSLLHQLDLEDDLLEYCEKIIIDIDQPLLVTQTIVSLQRAGIFSRELFEGILKSHTDVFSIKIYNPESDDFEDFSTILNLLINRRLLNQQMLNRLLNARDKVSTFELIFSLFDLNLTTEPLDIILDFPNHKGLINFMGLLFQGNILNRDNIIRFIQHPKANIMAKELAKCAPEFALNTLKFETLLNHPNPDLLLLAMHELNESNLLDDILFNFIAEPQFQTNVYAIARVIILLNNVLKMNFFSLNLLRLQPQLAMILAHNGQADFNKEHPIDFSFLSIRQDTVAMAQAARDPQHKMLVDLVVMIALNYSCPRGRNGLDPNSAEQVAEHFTTHRPLIPV